MTNKQRFDVINRNKLLSVVGVTDVALDDYDSTSVNVFISLDDANSRSGSLSGKKPYRFTHPLRNIKSGIKKAMREMGLGFNFLSWPELEYYSNGGDKVKDGYSQDHIKIEVFC